MNRQRLAAVLAAILIVCGGAATAEGPEAFHDFTFKRVKPPEAGAAKRITVQITAPPVYRTPPRPAGSGRSEADAGAEGGNGGSVGGAYAWYWDRVSPSLTRSSPGRLDEALLALRDAPPGQAINPPRLDHLREIVDRHGINILTSTIGTRVSPALVLAVISVESSGRSGAVSTAGAQGLMQLMPATAARFGVSDSFQPDQNIAGGVAYLDFLLKEFGYDPVLAIAGYNAGEGAVRENAGVPPYAETRGYVPKVLAAWQIARGLCQTPPELVTDGCVFVRSRGS